MTNVEKLLIKWKQAEEFGKPLPPVVYPSAKEAAETYGKCAKALEAAIQADAVSLPITGEVNPNHPVTQLVREHWHKIAALIMLKMQLKVVEFSLAEVEQLGKEETNIVFHATETTIFVRLVSNEEAKTIARRVGGLPI